MNESPFALRTVLILIAVGGCAIAGIVYLSLYGRDFGEPNTVEPSIYSRSSIGHKAFLETLRRLGIPVQVSRFNSAAKTRDSGLLIVAEPTDNEENDDLLQGLEELPQVLFVLPKWQGAPDSTDPRWAGAIRLLPEEEVLALYEKVMGKAKLRRYHGPETLSGGSFGGEIKLTDAQFVEDDDLKTLIPGRTGALLGEYSVGGKRLWVLSDPDLLSNQGIDEGENAGIAVAIIKALQQKGAPVVIDETVHGFAERPELLHKVFQLPYVIVTITGLLAVVLVIWAGSLRFGAPQRSEAVLAAGKGSLIRNAADLLSLGQSTGMVLTNYLRLATGEAMRELRGPNGLDETGQVAWLDAQAQRRGFARRLGPLRDSALQIANTRKPDSRLAVRLAVDIDQWKQEMLNGTRRGSSAG
ncbi:MAG TPA: DUF4350 domain-containing protein [Dongiaceae bacterium]|jgi:hypothetical protein